MDMLDAKFRNIKRLISDCYPTSPRCFIMGPLCNTPPKGV